MSKTGVIIFIFICLSLSTCCRYDQRNEYRRFLSPARGRCFCRHGNATSDIQYLWNICRPVPCPEDEEYHEGKCKKCMNGTRSMEGYQRCHTESEKLIWSYMFQTPTKGECDWRVGEFFETLREQRSYIEPGTMVYFLNFDQLICRASAAASGLKCPTRETLLGRQIGGSRLHQRLFNPRK